MYLCYESREPDLGWCISSQVFRLVSQLLALPDDPATPQKGKPKVIPTSWTKTHHPDSKCFQTEVCICSRWATQRKTKESALCVLAVLEIRSGRQRMKLFVYGLSQCSDVCFRSQGCDVGHVYLLDLSLVTHQSPEENQRAVQDSSSRWEKIFWDEILISHGLGFPSCTQCCLSVRGRRERERDGHIREDSKSKKARTLHMISTWACRNSASAHYYGTRKTLNQEDWSRVKERGGEREREGKAKRERGKANKEEKVFMRWERNRKSNKKRLEERQATCGRGGCVLSHGGRQNRR